MRTMAALVVMLALTACVTGGGGLLGPPGGIPAAGAGQIGPGGTDPRLEAERAACGARLQASPEARALTLQLSVSPNNGGATRPTPAEAAQMDRLHHEYLRPCQEIMLEIAGRIHPSLPPLYNAAAARADAAIARLVRREITWEDYARITYANRRELNARLRAAKAALGLPTLNGLDQPSPE